jgi:hypothetical protein
LNILILPEKESAAEKRKSYSLKKLIGLIKRSWGMSWYFEEYEQEGYLWKIKLSLLKQQNSQCFPLKR